jgi:hypothetical protein
VIKAESLSIPLCHRWSKKQMLSIEYQPTIGIGWSTSSVFFSKYPQCWHLGQDFMWLETSEYTFFQ